jgi:ABC-2 type transport system permease protein
VVAHLLRLKLQLLGNGLRRSTWQVVGLLLGLLNTVVLLGLTSLGLLATRRVSLELWEITVVFGGSVLVLAWWLLPLLAFGVDSTLDPYRFATFAVPRRTLLMGLGLAALVGMPGVATVVGVLLPVALWVPDLAAAAAAALMAPVVVATCVAGSRATTTALAPIMDSRRFREVAGVIALLPVLLLGPILIQIGRAAAVGRDAIPGLVEVVSWTPVGAAWAVSVDVSRGDWARAGGHLVVALGTLAVLVAVWHHFLGRALVTPPSGAGGARRALGVGVLGSAGGATTAVAARCLTYWLRDPRYVGSLTLIPVLPVVLGIVSGGNDLVVLLTIAPLCAFLVAWTISADLAYDSTAFWMHAATGLSGAADRAGRALAAVAVGGPILTGMVLGSVAWTGRWDALPAAAGLTVGIFATTLGLSSAISARFLYAVPKPGDGPFNAPQGSATANLVVQGIGWLVLVVLVAPEAVLALVAVQAESEPVGWAALVAGVGIGGVVLTAGVRLGARWYDARTPELMQSLRELD